MENPKPAPRSSLDNRGRSSEPVAGGRIARVFGRLIAALTSLHPLGVWLDTRLRGEMGG